MKKVWKTGIFNKDAGRFESDEYYDIYKSEDLFKNIKHKQTIRVYGEFYEPLYRCSGDDRGLVTAEKVGTL